MQYWEELRVGQLFKTGNISISPADIIEFATEFDPQPYHLDPVVAETSIFGGHCSSGWQVCALMMRLLADTLNDQAIPSIGSAGVSSLRWLKPVFANDNLNATIEIVGHRKSQDQHGIGLIDCDIDVKNQHGKSVIVLSTDIMIECSPVSGGKNNG